MNTIRRRTLARSAALAGIVSLGLTACGSGDAGSGTEAPSSADAEQSMEAALEKGGELTAWAWDPNMQEIVDSFEEEYPNVTVNLSNVGTGTDEYTSLQNAIAAGDGIPDVAVLEYYALPQFALGGALADLTPYGAADLDGTFSPGTWESVQQGGKIVGLPQNSGPMAMFYNKAVFDAHGIEVPTTWDEYYEAAKTLHEADPNAYITSDNGDPGFVESMIWQAGGRPYSVDGTDVSIDFSDEGSQKFATQWQKMIDEGLLSSVNGWTDEWFQGLGDGTIASLVTGAWMPTNLESGAAAASGDWRVAPMPQWEDGESVTSENGGGAMSVMEASENKELAYAFAHYVEVGPGTQVHLDKGNFPATLAELNSDEFLNKEVEYFGGQKINEVLSQSATDVAPGWQFLPYQPYANSIFPDTAGKAYIDASTTLADGLQSWQDASVKYGNQQGFSVNK
ncbi:sugar ABC transporter substrate-binding protein [Paraoerskovia sediminicola]|uniref:Sugar ABC transporter substrate-binding protein n=1 Tax=Paraoerskovia sediminicola TaxID=1138587 RepID=A0ABN6XBJ1_9CELL|nr:extracellular solute-binding protein [Paraoerskovia sediminicola]BDZ42192.1 sugar ABC transporter substrate-binding protein [Paraoerskovia sediminicola]